MLKFPFSKSVCTLKKTIPRRDATIRITAMVQFKAAIKFLVVPEYPRWAQMMLSGWQASSIVNHFLKKCFFLSAFEPPHPDPEWSKVYPELALDYDGPVSQKRATAQGPKPKLS